MRPFYWATTTNFGDAMNAWLWGRIFPEMMSPDDGLRLVGVGSLIKKELSYVKGGRKIIFGSGSGYGEFPSKEALRKWIIYFVRGPLTAKYLGLDQSYGIVDASWLIGRLPEFALPSRKNGTVLVPHFSNHIASSWETVCARTDITYINPLQGSFEVINSIARAELAIVESLHGAIIADYFRTPWIPLKLSENMLSFKWIDWCQSVDVVYQPYIMPLTDVYHHLTNRRFPARAIGYTQVTETLCEPPSTDTDTRTAGYDAQPSITYVLRQHLKAKLKSAATTVRGACLSQRNVWPLRPWNERQEEKLAGLLTKIARADPCLSTDRKRESLLDQLDAKVEQLLSDYPRLVAGETPPGVTIGRRHST